ncbi:nuclear transport factor 2 family protein [Actinacidiphila rubida]|uniref:SnoaL-like domain-containing protein n=1 Tax=Actinacidiphila rubida TaxID=310780 RepID=A0A1H8MWE9_9ACTN|nr:nuclear transport factor 2 family protein [Actinacidiphila rubida]SEO21586.1 SnoaL-like domain-containing protein [Actinacidiphila rubida]
MSEEYRDRAAIVDVAVAYATALDTRDWTLLGSVFAEDASWAYSGSGEQVRGRDAILARLSAGMGHYDATHHLNGNHVVVVHGDEAEHTCYFQAQHVRRGLPGGENLLAGGRYEDRLRRTPDGWRITHREVTKVWSEGNPAVSSS